MGEHSTIPPKVLLINDNISFYHCTIQELRTFKMNKAYNALCDNGVLKPEYRHLEITGLTHALYMKNDFKIK